MSLPLVLEDGRACGLDVMRIIDGGHAPETDRRKRVRVALSLTVYLYRSSQTHPVKGKTKNVSTDGFYCHVQEPFTIGEGIRVIVAIPAYEPGQGDQSMSLECQARVVRNEALDPDTYGVACHIESYHVVQSRNGDAGRFAL